MRYVAIVGLMLLACCGLVFGTQYYEFANGASSKSITVLILGPNGDPNASCTVTNLDLYVTRVGDRQVKVCDLADLGAADAAWDDEEAYHLGNGWYRVDIPDANLSDGAGQILQYLVLDASTTNTFDWGMAQVKLYAGDPNSLTTPLASISRVGGDAVPCSIDDLFDDAFDQSADTVNVSSASKNAIVSAVDANSTALLAGATAAAAAQVAAEDAEAAIGDVNTAMNDLGASFVDVNTVLATALTEISDLDANQIILATEVADTDANVALVLADTAAMDTAGEMQTLVFGGTATAYKGSVADEVVTHMDANSTLVADVLTTTVASATNNSTFVLTAGPTVVNAHLYSIIEITDATDAHTEGRVIVGYTAGRAVRVNAPFSFLPAAADVAVVRSGYFIPAKPD